MGNIAIVSKPRRRLEILLFLPIVMLGLGGCSVGWLSVRDAQASRFEEVMGGPVPPKKNLRLTVQMRDERAGDAEDTIRRSVRYEDSGEAFLRDTGLFESVSTGRTIADLHLKLDLRETMVGNRYLSALNVVTLGLFPHRVKVELEGTGTVFGLREAVLGQVAIREEMTLIISWLMLPIHPTSLVAYRHYQQDMFKSALVQMLENKAIWAQAPGDPILPEPR